MPRRAGFAAGAAAGLCGGAPGVSGWGEGGRRPPQGLPDSRRKSPASRSTKPGLATMLEIARKPPAERSMFPWAPFQRQLSLATLPVPTGPAQKDSTLWRCVELLMMFRVTTLPLDAYEAEYSPPPASLEKITPSPLPSITLLVASEFFALG